MGKVLFPDFKRENAEKMIDKILGSQPPSSAGIIYPPKSILWKKWSPAHHTIQIVKIIKGIRIPAFRDFD